MWGLDQARAREGRREGDDDDNDNDNDDDEIVRFLSCVSKKEKEREL